MKDKVVICTIKSWNFREFEKLKDRFKGIDFYIIKDKEKLTYEKLAKLNPSYVFFPHWSWTISRRLYNNFKCIGFHMTDLPYGRGGSPLQNLIVRGFKKTKISAIKIEEKLDSGPIYIKREVSLDGSAEDILKRVSKIIFQDMIPYIINNNPKPTPQKGTVTKFNRRKPIYGDISNLNELKKIYDHIRMLDAEGYPPAFLKTKNIRLEFSNAKMDNKKLTAKVRIKVEK